MNVSVDEAGNNPLPSRIDGLRVVGHANFIARTDVANAAVLNDDRAVADGGITGSCNNRGALDNRDAALTLLCTNERRHEQTAHREANLPRIHACLPRAESEFPFAP